MENEDKAQIKELMSNEQTFLAWIRTGIEVMVFGIVAIKFSLFMSQVVGIILVGVGSLMTILAYFRYRRTFNEIRNGNYKYSITMLTVTTIIIFIISVLLIFCLISAFLNSR